MILKASQRGSGQDLAAHLMRLDDNEHVALHELRGFASDNLKDAFKEVEAISRGTQCRQYLFSLSISPPADAKVSAETFTQTIDRIEERLGLTGQPRAVVFHEKEARLHAHCVWSRIDTETMTAKQMSFFKQKLMSVSRDLHLEFGWKMPDGMVDRLARNPTNFTLAEWQQAKRQGVDPRWTKQVLQSCWATSDSKRAFERSLEERGFFLAKGDKRGHVVLDHTGEVYSLPRMLDLKTKDVRARLGDGNDLASVADTQNAISERMRPAIRRHIDEARTKFQGKAAALNVRKDAMTVRHRAARSELQDRLQAEWQAGCIERAERLPTGWRGLWARVTGKHREIREQNQLEAAGTLSRHAIERDDLVSSQRVERAALQSEIKTLRHQQAKQLLELRQEVGRYLRFQRQHDVPDRGRRTGLDLRLER